MDEVRWGIIGAGNVAEFKGGPALQQARGSSLGAVMRRDAEQARAFAARMGVPRTYSTLDDMLADDEIDAVYIATPVASHAELTVAAARAGKHVLVEKPMGMSLDECRRMLAACRTNGVQLGVAYYRRFYPILLRMRELIETGVIGEVVAARVQYATSHVPSSGADMDWRLQPSISGGGCLADVGSHRLDLLLTLLGPASHASAVMVDWEPFGVDRAAQVQLGMRSGALASCSVVWGSGGFCDELEIIGSAGRLLASPLDQGRLQRFHGRDFVEEQLPVMQPTHLGLVQDFVDALREGRAPHASGEAGMATSAVLEAAYLSARERLVMTFDEQGSLV